MKLELGKIKATPIAKDIKSLVFCPQCRRVLYQMPTEDISGVYKRVAENVINGHSEIIRKHFPVIVFRENSLNEKYEQDMKMVNLMSNIYRDSIM